MATRAARRTRAHQARVVARDARPHARALANSTERGGELASGTSRGGRAENGSLRGVICIRRLPPIVAIRIVEILFAKITKRDSARK